jgi:nitrogen regulatory protein P-II 1
MKTIIAVVRTESLEQIVASLEDMGIRGMTITEIKGTGEEVSLYKPYTIHNRVEIIVPDGRVDEVTRVIVRHGKTGFAGDGLIGVYPMDYMIKIRTGERRTD